MLVNRLYQSHGWFQFLFLQEFLFQIQEQNNYFFLIRLMANENLLTPCNKDSMKIWAQRFNCSK